MCDHSSMSHIIWHFFNRKRLRFVSAIVYVTGRNISSCADCRPLYRSNMCTRRRCKRWFTRYPVRHRIILSYGRPLHRRIVSNVKDSCGVWRDKVCDVQNAVSRHTRNAKTCWMRTVYNVRPALCFALFYNSETWFNSTLKCPTDGHFDWNVCS
jgi:hypothetical protein